MRSLGDDMKKEWGNKPCGPVPPRSDGSGKFEASHKTDVALPGPPGCANNPSPAASSCVSRRGRGRGSKAGHHLATTSLPLDEMRWLSGGMAQMGELDAVIVRQLVVRAPQTPT